MQINKSGNGFLVLEDEEDIFIDRDNVGYSPSTQDFKLA